MCEALNRRESCQSSALFLLSAFTARPMIQGLPSRVGTHRQSGCRGGCFRGMDRRCHFSGHGNQRGTRHPMCERRFGVSKSIDRGAGRSTRLRNA